MVDQELWEKAFLAHYGSSLRSKSRRFYQDISCALLGVKPAHLVDYMPLSSRENDSPGGLANNLQLFLRELCQLHRHRGQPKSRDLLWTQQDLCLLLLEDNVLFVNCTALQSLRQATPPPVLVDVTKGLSRPKVLARAERCHVAIERSFLACMQLMRRHFLLNPGDLSIPILRYNSQTSPSNKSHDPNCESREPDCDLNCESRDPSCESCDSNCGSCDPNHESCDPNCCTLLGWLLDYPVVYWFDWEAGCCSLSMEPLKRHSLQIRNRKRVYTPAKQPLQVPYFIVGDCVCVCWGGGCVAMIMIEPGTPSTTVTTVN